MEPDLIHIVDFWHYIYAWKKKFSKFAIGDRNKKVCACLHMCVCACTNVCVCVCVQYQQSQPGQKRKKPTYSSVDLSEVEWEDKDDFVRYTHTFKHTH